MEIPKRSNIFVFMCFLFTIIVLRVYLHQDISLGVSSMFAMFGTTYKIPDYKEMQSCLKKIKNISAIRWKFKENSAKPMVILNTTNIKGLKRLENKTRYSAGKHLQNVTRNELEIYRSNDTISNDIFISGRRYITLHDIRGRLGNQMFQVAALIGIANLSGHVPILQNRILPLSEVFDLPSKLFKNMDTARFKVYTQSNDATWMDFDKVDWMQNLTFKGYFQFYQPFHHLKDRLKDIFRFKKLFVKNGKDFISSNVPKGNIKVGIHVRRGDYLKPAEMKIGRVTPGVDYYRHAMEFYRCTCVNVTFIVVTDDKPWCLKNLRAPDTIVSNFTQTGDDLALMTMCDHTIMSVGTFGWWGAWLAGGTVVYYGEPNRPGSKKYKTFTLENHFPSDWIGLS